MRSVILQTAARYLLSLLLLFSLFLLVRGHNAPGGGFAGGLVAGSAYTLYAYAYDVETTLRALTVSPRTLIASGLLVLLLVAAFPLLLGKPPLAGLWADLTIPFYRTVSVGTPLLFDVGVYLTVLGMTTTVTLAWEGT